MLGHPLMDNPLTNPLAGGFEFMKNLWGDLPSSVPGFVVPTVDLEELDKRIKDLKAVESWLALNANMLRATVQSLEVQRNTIATLKSFSGSLSGSANEVLGHISKAAQPAHAGGYANWPNPTPAKPARKAARPAAEKAGSKTSAPDKKRNGAPAESSAPGIDAAGQTAATWLSFLQDQFNQVAKAALAGSGGQGKAAAPQGAAPAAPAGGPKRADAPSGAGPQAPPKRARAKSKP
jgi:hypothetical protein